jgi:hypothetical protein
MLGNNPNTNYNNNNSADYKDFCEAFGCSAIATKKINLSAGSYGNLTIKVCDKCIQLFQK